jgi:hypothetical protein
MFTPHTIGGTYATYENGVKFKSVFAIGAKLESVFVIDVKWRTKGQNQNKNQR